MNKLFLGVMGLAGVLALAACSTTRGSSSVENRIQALENKVQMLEGGTSSGSAMMTTDTTDKIDSGMTAETMTKKQIQKALKNAGYYDGTVDGKFGQKTKTAIMEFQKATGLTADGVAGRNTKEKLLKYLS